MPDRIAVGRENWAIVCWGAAIAITVIANTYS